MRPSPRGGGGGGERAAGTAARIGTDSRRPRGRCCVKRSEARSATRRRAKSAANPRGGGQTPSRQARAPAQATRGVRAACKARSSGAGDKRAGGPAVPLNRLHRPPPPPPPLSPAVCQPFPNPCVTELPHHGKFHWVRRRGCQTPGHKESGNQPGLGVRGPRRPQPPRSAAAHAAAPRRCPRRRAPPPRGGRPAADTPPTPARALGVAARTPRGSRDTPARPPSGQPGLSPPHPPPPRRPLAELPGRWSRPGGAPPPGEAACGRCPSPEQEGRFPGALALFMQS
ncbi:basic proline-rich protein-like [Cervus canadensis]|uniref:basic proline-rich protein-like n=1 Tax=Cervus canadensis TaxID=1574408 RepID=UPI001CA346E5|nr:basic proline-rich protein-like [Cervus canadensis]